MPTKRLTGLLLICMGSVLTAQAPPVFKVPDGTALRLSLTQELSSASNAVDDPVHFEVVEDVKVAGVVAFPRGSTAVGHVVEVEPRRRMGRAGNYARQDSPDSDDGNLWQIRVDNQAGTPAGKPKRVTPWAGSYLWSLSASADGMRLVILKRTDQVQVYVAELMADGTRMKLPRLLSNDEGNINPTAWMPDSKAVLFHSNRNGTFGIFKQGISQETVEPIFTGPQGAAGARLSADGAWILFFETAVSSNPAPGYRLMRIPASGGVPQFVLETRTLNPLDMRCARGPASLCVIAETSQDENQFIITAFDPLKGRGQVLRTIQKDPSQAYGGTLSANGSTYAISRVGEAEIHIRLLSLSAGADREITVKGWPSATNLDWSADGKGLYCSSQSSQGSTLLYVDLKGNARVLWQNKGGGGPIWGMQSPDGRYLAIQSTVTNSNVWMVEGF